MQLVSFEEVIACVGALMAGLLAYLLGRNWFASPAIASGLIGMSLGIALAIVSTTKFVLTTENITYGSMFWSDVTRLGEIEEVVVRPSLGVIPGRVVHFRMRPGSRVAMTSTRIGVLSWPSAYAWVEAANVAINRGKIQN